MKNIFINSILIVVLSACGSIERVDNAAIREEIKNRQVKQISSQQFTAITEKWGKDFATSILKELNENLIKYPNKQTELCNLIGLKKTDSVKTIYNLGINILKRKDLSNKSLTAKESEILDAFAYNAENKMEPISSVQKLNDSLMFYSIQLPYNSAICKKCIENDPTNLAVLGIIIPKKTIIQKITVKELKKIQ